jgi:hypothetical protein
LRHKTNNSKSAFGKKVSARDTGQKIRNVENAEFCRKMTIRHHFLWKLIGVGEYECPAKNQEKSGHV